MAQFCLLGTFLRVKIELNREVMMGKNIKITGKVGVIIGILFISFFPVKLLSQYSDWINYTNGQGVRAVAIEGSKIWVGTYGGLVMIDTLTDTTIFYNHANSGLPDNSVYAIAIDASGNKWIGTRYGGLAVYSGGTGIEEENDEKVEIGTMKVYSNPFTGIAQIRYGVPEDVDVNISVYNLLGQKVATLVNGNRKAGYYTVTWDGSKLSAGIYFIKLKAGSFKQTEKIILMK